MVVHVFPAGMLVREMTWGEGRKKLGKKRSGAGNRTRVLWVRATDANPYTTSEMSVEQFTTFYT